MTETITRVPRTYSEQRRNRAWNPRCANNIDGYYTQMHGGTGTPTLVRITGAGSPVTTLAARMTLAGSVTTDWGIRFAIINVVPGTVYTFSAYGRPNVAKNTLAAIEWLDGTGTYLSTSAGTPAAHAANVWAQRSVAAVTAPVGAVQASVTFRVDGTGASGNILDMTGLLMEAASTVGSFFVGSAPDAPPWFYSWAGAEDASDSIASIENPADIIETDIIDGYEANSNSRTTVHAVLNSSDVVVTLQPTERRAGSLDLIFPSKGDAIAAFNLLSAPSLFSLVSSIGYPPNMTFAVTGGQLGIRLDRETRSVWVVTVPFHAVSG
ncbi:MAG: hypothetical protein ABWY36_06245 [Leifsonia sp.]